MISHSSKTVNYSWYCGAATNHIFFFDNSKDYTMVTYSNSFFCPTNSLKAKFAPFIIIYDTEKYQILTIEEQEAANVGEKKIQMIDQLTVAD